MPKGDQISLMADSVVCLIKESGYRDFAQAFARVLRNQGRRLTNDQFNTELRAVQRRLMQRTSTREIVYPTLKSFVQRRYNRRPPNKRPTPAPGTRMHFPVERPFLDNSPDRGYLYEDNRGFIHHSANPFLEAACDDDLPIQEPSGYFTPRGRIKPGIRTEPDS